VGGATSNREWIDIIDWTTILGVISVLPCAYFWGCGLAIELWSVRPPGDPALLLLAIWGSVPLSAVVGAYGSRYWWLVTALAIGTFLFVVLRLH
jgi:hypothetical protein